jgi:hypothetical protein
MTSQPYPHDVILDGERYMDTATLLQFQTSHKNTFPDLLRERLDPGGKHVVVKIQALSERFCRVRVKCKLAGRDDPFEISLYGLRGLIEDLPRYRPTHQRVVVAYDQNPLRDIMFPNGYLTAPSRILKEDDGS